MVGRKTVVMIPTLNEEAHIEAVLHALIQHDPIASVCDIIVADGGSTDNTRKIVRAAMFRFPNLRLLHNPGRTQAAAMNMLLAPEFHDVDIVVRCDAHAIYPPNFVSDTVNALIIRDAASVVVTMDAVAGANVGTFGRAVAMVADSKLGAGGSPHRGGHISAYVDHGHHAAFRMDVFRALQGYDRSFVANEDAEYDRRLVIAGHKIWLAGDIRIGYVPRDTARGLWRQYFRYGRGRAATCLKHRLRPKARQMIPFAHVLLLLMSFAALPFTLLGLIWPLAYGLLITGAALMMAVRSKSLFALLAAPALAIIHIGWGIGFLGGILSGTPPNRTGNNP